MKVLDLVVTSMGIISSILIALVYLGASAFVVWAVYRLVIHLTG